MQQVLCFGEILLRMSPEPGWPDNPLLKTYVGGAEVNVALALANWAVPVSVGTAIPDNFMADQIRQYLVSAGVLTDKIIQTGSRIGTYYLHQGADLKSAGAIYDRAYSAFAELKPEDLDLDSYLEGISHLHLTAISPAVSASAAAVCHALIEAAAKKNIQISLDLNYRSKLWKYGKTPLEVIPALAKYAHTIMGNIWAANQMLGTPVDPAAERTTDPNELAKYAADSSAAVIEAFPTCKLVANTFRFSENDEQVKYFATIYTAGQGRLYTSAQQVYSAIVDRAGSGDCFMAGLLYGSLKNYEEQKMVDFATAAATGKFYEMGDHTRQTLSAIEQRMKKQSLIQKSL